MNFFSDRNVPYMNGNQQTNRQQTLIKIIGILGVLLLLLLIVMTVFNDDSYQVQLDRAIIAQAQTEGIAELVKEYASDGSTVNLAAAASAVASSNIGTLNEYRSRTLGSSSPSSNIDFTDQEASLEAARQAGAVREISLELLSLSIQDDIKQLTETAKLVTNEEFSAVLDQMISDSSDLLNTIEDN